MSSSPSYIQQAEYAEPPRERKVPWVPIVLILALAAMALLAPIISSYDPKALNLRDARTPPFQTWEYPLGTDLIGKDVLSRLIYGARTVAVISMAALVGGVIVGTGIGLIMARLGRRIDAIIMRNLYVVIAVSCLWSLTTVILMGTGLMPTAISAIAFPALYIASLAGKEEIRVKDKGFSVKVITLASLSVVGAVLVEAFLSVQGLGGMAGMPAWGVMLAEGIQSSPHVWWLLLFPGTTIAAVVTLLYFFSLRNVLYLKDYHQWSDY